MRSKVTETDLNTDHTQEAFDEHFKTEHFAALGKLIGEGGLLARPLDIKKVRPFGGFESR